MYLSSYVYLFYITVKLVHYSLLLFQMSTLSTRGRGGRGGRRGRGRSHVDPTPDPTADPVAHVDPTPLVPPLVQTDHISGTTAASSSPSTSPATGQSSMASAPDLPIGYQLGARDPADNKTWIGPASRHE